MTLSLSAKLTQFENKFAALEKDINVKGIKSLYGKPELFRGLQMLNRYKIAFDKFDCAVKGKLTKWRIGKISAEQAYSQPPESKKLTARYNRVQTLKKVAIVAAIIFVVIANVVAFVGVIISYPPVLPSLAPIALKWVAAISISGGVACPLSIVVSEALNYVPVVRERRVEQSKDFHDFVCKYVNNSDNGFYATKEQMMDLKLHSLYKNYKKHINKLHHMIMSYHQNLKTNDSVIEGV